jgi:dTDP-4-dehydrorhamnose reductase
MLRVLVIGGNGMLGHKLVQQLAARFDVWSTVRTTFENVARFGIFGRETTIDSVWLDDEESLINAIQLSKPDVVINAAGVVKQVPNSNDVVTTLTVNAILPHRLNQLSRKYGFRLILISTDCVFRGDRGNYSEDDDADALDLYGRSKNLGEVNDQRCLTIRTSIIGRELTTTHGLIEWFLSNHGGSVKGFTRAIYSGFPTVVFADIIADLLLENPDLSGLYHISSDPIDKFRLLSLVNAAYKADIAIEPDDSFEIDRSLDSSRFRDATGFCPPDWETMIHQMACDPTPYDDWRK